MKTTTMMLALSLIVLSSTASVRAGAQDNGTYAWPYLIVSGRDSIWLYQPQGTSWSGSSLSGSQAVSIRTQGESQERYGVLYFQANTNDAGNGKVMLSNYSVTKQNFPSLTDNGASLVQAISANSGALPAVNKAKLQSDVSQSAGNPNAAQQGIQVKNDPPAVLHSNDPALLINVDGAPKMTQVQGTNYQRVINTNYLILSDGSNYFTPIGDKWAVTTDLSNAQWSVTPNVDALNDAKTKVQQDKNINLSIPDNTADEVATAAQNGTIPMLYVSTTPAELLITNGPPDFQPINGTNLLYAQNAKGDMFKSIDDNRTYTLLSGRWYSAPNIDGPWTWVDPSQLPADFAKIPQDHPEARVLVSIPNTSQANESLIANTIPQTATVDRNNTSFTASFDGDPKWKGISGTDLQYAANSSVPVIRDGDAFYACSKAVWFQANSPMGPWVVCTNVPNEIYDIPSNSPVYNVTYVKVYDEDADDVTYGYTPGYFGVYNSYWGVPVYGTGWWYRPWIGSYWYAPPFTWGYGACFGWGGYGFGACFNFGFGFYSPIYRPYWGPWGWYHPYGWYGGGWRGGVVFANRVNIYNSWGVRGGVRINSNPAWGGRGTIGVNRAGGGAGLYHPGTPINRVNGINSTVSRGNIYNPNRNTVNGGRTATIGNPGGGFNRPNGTTNNVNNVNRTPQTMTQRNFNSQSQQQRTYQPQQRQGNVQQRSQPAQRSFSAPRANFGGGGFHPSGGGGGGSHGGGGGFHGGGGRH